MLQNILLTLHVSTREGRPTTLQFKQAQLSNGLDIIAEVNDSAHSAALGFMVKTGSRDESAEVSGVSHFLEHMMFKGTAKRNSQQVNEEFDAMGAKNNAFTSNEVTCYWAQILPEFTDRTLELLSDMMRPALRTEDFTMEKKVILEEIALYLDRPAHVLFEAIMSDHFEKHAMAHSVLGSKESISALARDQMKNYFDARYGPGNMVLAVAGNVNFEQVIRSAEKYCGHWKHVSVQRAYAARPSSAPAAATSRMPSSSATILRASAPALRRRTIPATPPWSCPMCWAITRARASSGRWSSRVWPMRRISPSTRTTGPAHS